jgi:CARDB protein
LQVDNSNSVVEANEGNNTLTKTLSCQPPAPDLVPVSIGLTSQCQLVITLMNIGTAPLPDSAFALPNGGAIQMYADGAPFGGIALGALDFTKQLQPVGGSITYNWFSSLRLTPGGHVVSLVVDRDNTIFELNEGNNTLTRTLWCGGIIRYPNLLQP